MFKCEGQQSAQDFLKLGARDCINTNLESAITNLTRAIELSTNNDLTLEIYEERAYVKTLKKDWSGAVADADQMVKVNPKYQRSYSTRGWIKLERGDYDGAIDDFSICIQLDSKSADNYAERSDAESLKGDFDAALADINRSIQIDPDAYYLIERGWIRVQNKTFDSAIVDAVKVIDLKPKSPLGYNIRAWARYGRGDLMGASEDCQKVIQLCDDRPQEKIIKISSQGLLSFINGDSKNAIVCWDEVVQLDKTSQRELQPWIEKAQAKLQNKTP